MTLLKISASRKNLLLIFLGIFLFLDLFRSIYARVGYQYPNEVWDPPPSQYANLSWPPGSDLPTDTPVGKKVYLERCAVCHGPDGRGNGPAAPSLIPKPRDFTKGKFKYQSTPEGQPPTDEDLIQVVTHGLQASVMPYWRDILTPEEIREVVDYIKQFSPVFEDSDPESVEIPTRVSPTPESISRGRELFGSKGCLGCHGHDGRIGIKMKDSNGNPVISRDLSAPWTFRGGSDPDQIWLRLTTGLAPSPMPSYQKLATPEERWDIVNFVLTLRRIPPWKPGGELDGPGQSSNLLKRGEYLVHSEMCGLCHTQINHTGIYRADTFYLAGGMRVDAYPHGIFISRNLTSDPDTGLGNWTVEEIVNAVRNGRSRDRILNPLDMPWGFLHGFQEKDALAIAEYLKKLPPVYNKIPDPLHYGYLETVLVKLTRPNPPAFVPEVLVFADGNFGYKNPGPKEPVLQMALILGQWLTIGIGVFLYFQADPLGNRVARSRNKKKLSWFGKGIVVLFLGLTGWFLYQTPTISWIPPDQIAKDIQGDIFSPDPSRLKNKEYRNLVERGRYLYTVASCALCHGTDGRGGAKISWKPIGTIWTRNITPDPVTGIGTWTDPEISRAVRSGITPDGRTLHWQGMPWDHASNWDEEDIRALVAYLKFLPPVNLAIPPSVPPSASDCPKYTFWLSMSFTPGCH